MSVLTVEQQQRIEALREARELLTAKPSPYASSATWNYSTAPSPLALIALANFICTGAANRGKAPAPATNEEDGSDDD